MKEPKIIIVGAGAAGIAAAVRLLENGYTDIIILEAENRIGGRINTINHMDSVFDLGAQWCHGEKGNIVFETVKNLDLLHTSLCTYKDNTFFNSTGCKVDKELTDSLFSTAASITYDYEIMKNIGGSFGDYFIKHYINAVKKYFGSNKPCLDIANKFVHWFHKLVLCYDAPPTWFDISASGLLEYSDCEGDPLLNWKDKGYKLFLDVLMKKFPNDAEKWPVEEKILFNKEIRKIMWNNYYTNTATVYCNDGTSYSADHVIITMSLGVLKEQYKHMFIPELPFFKENAILGLGFGTVNKILLKFPIRWWDLEATSFCFLWSEDDRMNILNEFPYGPMKEAHSWLEDINGFYVVDSDSTTLMAWMVGEFSEEVELLSNEIIQGGCMYLLEKFLGEYHHIPAPTNVLCSKWNSNSHFRGSYSYRSIDGDRRKTSADALAEPMIGAAKKPVLLFAGEATHSHYYSTVHGAVETGFREADRILKLYRASDSDHIKGDCLPTLMANL